MAPIRLGDGTGIGSIRLGDGTGIDEVRTGDGQTVFLSSLRVESDEGARVQSLLDTATATFSNQSLGTAASNRQLIVMTGGFEETPESPIVTNVEIGNSNMTELLNANFTFTDTGFATTHAIHVLQDNGTEGTSADITITFEDTVRDVGIRVLRTGPGQTVSDSVSVRSNSTLQGDESAIQLYLNTQQNGNFVTSITDFDDATIESLDYGSQEKFTTAFNSPSNASTTTVEHITAGGSTNLTSALLLNK